MVKEKKKVLAVGKIPNSLLQTLIIDHITIKNPEVLISPGVGEDCTALDFGEYLCILSTDPITGTAAEVGKLAVHINCNDIASCGIKPLGLMVTILAPFGATEEDLAMVSRQLNEAADAIGVDIIGGHTEVTRAVTRFVLTTVAVGKTSKGKMVTTAGARAGDDIVMTKGAGIEGTAIIAYEKEKELLPVIGEELLNKAKGYMDMLSVVPEGVLAGEYGVHAMHDVTEGGLLGAVWEVCHASGIGAIIDERKIPVSAETLGICTHYHIDPLKLISSGCMLITCENGNGLVDRLAAAGIKAAVIGKAQPGGIVMVANNGAEVPISEPESDELYKVLNE